MLIEQQGKKIPKTQAVSVEYDPTKELTEDFAVSKAVYYKTVDIFSGIVGRRLRLKDGKSTCTDGTTITIPMVKPDAYSRLEHELAHVLFRSDAVAKAVFLRQWTNDIARACRKQGGKDLSLDIVTALYAQMSVTIDILEDHRVNSLWRVLYPGSYATIKETEKACSLRETPDAHKNLLSYFVRLYACGDAPEGKYSEFRPLFEEAMRRVERRGFGATLLSARWLLVQLVSQMIRDTPLIPPAKDLAELEAERLAEQKDDGGNAGLSGVELEDGEDIPDDPLWEPEQPDASNDERIDALQSLTEEMGELLPYAKERVSDVAEPVFGMRGQTVKAQALVSKALSADPSDPAVLAAMRAEMTGVVREAKKALRGEPTNHQRFQMDTPAKVVFHDVTREQVEAAGIVAKPMPPEDVSTVSRLRAMFIRLMGRTRNALEDSGAEVDVQALIERKLSGEPLPVFRHAERGQGFRCMILIDKSHSMGEDRETKSRISHAYRAARIINRALDFPFVKRDVWGWTSTADGQVDIARFDPKLEVYATPGTKFSGVTPLHLAIRLAVKEMEPGNEVKQLIVLTDGAPTYVRRDGTPIPEERLKQYVRAEVQAARRKGINVTTVMIGDECNNRELTFMFGAAKNWKVVDSATFTRDLVGVVATSFADFLRKR